MKIEMAAFDVAGTVLSDEGLVISAFKKAFESSEPELWPLHGAEWTQFAIDTMGQSKIQVFTELLGNFDRAHAANIAFEKAYTQQILEIGAIPIDGAEELIKYLKGKGIPVALTTGFSRATLDVILNQLGWKELVDTTVTPGEAGRGRPHPDMLIMAMQNLGLSSAADVLVCGDTGSDMEAGVAFGSNHIIGVLSGVHDEETLRNSGATLVVNSVAALKSLI